jgi:hypothetical protein
MMNNPTRTLDELQDYIDKATTDGFDSCDESIYLRGKFVEDCFYWLPKLIAAYKRFDPETQIGIIWCIKDVQDINNGLTDEQAVEVLDYIERKHDANYGISWDTISFAIEDLYPDVEHDHEREDES